jgi:Rad3-related DNA helicase
VVKQKDWNWYAWRTIRTLTQAAGRCVRSEDDWVRTYILDECFLDVLERNEKLVPAHLRASIEVEEPF